MSSVPDEVKNTNNNNKINNNKNNNNTSSPTAPNPNANNNTPTKYQIQEIQKIARLILGGYLYTILAYPFYRKFLEFKLFGLQSISKNFYYPKSKEIDFSIKNRNGFYAGAASYIIAHVVANPAVGYRQPFNHISKRIFKSKVLQELTSNFLFSSVFLYCSYRFLVNSNNKAINSEFYRNLRNPKNFWAILDPKYNNRGTLLYVVNGLIGKIPLLNLLVCYRLESIRFAFVYGVNEKGEPFTSYNHARKFVSENDSIRKGRIFYNMMFVPYYIYLFSHLIYLHNGKKRRGEGS